MEEQEHVWQRNLRDALLLDPLILVHGNVKDVYRVPDDSRDSLPLPLRDAGFVSFDHWLALEFERQGYSIVLLYDNIDHGVALRRKMAQQFTELAVASRPIERHSVSKLTSPATPVLPTSASPDDDTASNWLVPLQSAQEPADFFRTLYQAVFLKTTEAVAVVCRFTDRYLSFTDRQNESEKKLSLIIQKAAMAIPHPQGATIHSRIVLLFDLEGQIPQELQIQAPFAGSVRLPLPTLEEREQFFRENCQQFHSTPNDRFDPGTDKKQLDELANLSNGLRMQDLISLRALSRHHAIGLGKSDARKLFDHFRFGKQDNVWEKIKPEKLKGARESLRADVKGQDEVIDEVIPILIRARLGMSSLGSARASRPRGTFFFVGPTGVGKTELSKAIARLMFSDENRLLRFDMSEYKQEHQQARLIGAPPGYTGFDQGGQLTNAVKDQPFSVILFDEIEKANGKIWDSFLQVLDDGRLTDGRGQTVYFSEAILIFTSNLGTSPEPTHWSAQYMSATAKAELEQHLTGGTLEQFPAVRDALPTLSYNTLCEYFRSSVRHFFVNSLGRPEILNRLGENNILVFRYLNDPREQEQIVWKEIVAIREQLHSTFGVGLKPTSSFIRLLMVHEGGFRRNGARGVRNLLAKWVTNQIAMKMFENRAECEGKVFQPDYKVELDELTVAHKFDPVKLTMEPRPASLLKYQWDNEPREPMKGSDVEHHNG